MREATKGQKNSHVRRLSYGLWEAAQLIGVSKNHLINEHKRGLLNVVKSGRRTLVTDAELRRYLGALEDKRSQPETDANSHEQ